MQDNTAQDSKYRDAGRFQTTQWSLVLEAGGVSSPSARRALAELCETYWFPLYFYVRHRVRDSHEAQDLTQEFFARLLDKEIVAHADPDRGRFRAFLITSLKNFLVNEWDKGKARKRGAGRLPISLDFEKADSRFQLEPTDELTPERLYERQWTIALLDHVLGRLRAECEGAGKQQQFEALKRFITGENGGSGYSAAAQRLEISENSARQAALRLRKRYRELLRAEISMTVASPGEVDDEIKRLFRSLES